MSNFHCDTIGVAAVGTTGQSTVVVPQQPFAQKAVLCAQGTGVYVGGRPINRTAEGFMLPSGVPVTFDIEPNCGLWGISAAGTVALSREYGEKLDATANVVATLQAVLNALSPVPVAVPPSLHTTPDQQLFWRPIGSK